MLMEAILVKLSGSRPPPRDKPGEERVQQLLEWEKGVTGSELDKTTIYACMKLSNDNF